MCRGVGKLVGRSPSAAGPSSTRPATLGTVADKITRQQCLLDTGSQVSLWPPSTTTPRIGQSRIKLVAANGTPIQCYGQQTRKINIGGKRYSFVFFITNMSRPILGIDFLLQFKMTIDLCNRQLIHSGPPAFLPATARSPGSMSSSQPAHLFRLRSLTSSGSFRRSQTPLWHQPQPATESNVTFLRTDPWFGCHRDV